MKPLFFLLTFVILISCGGGDDGAPLPPPSVNLDGTWSGTWLSSNGINTGQLGLNLSQSGASVTGTASFPGGTCFTGGNVSGTVSANNIKGGLVSAGNLRIEFGATVVSNTLNGDYNVIQGGACTGDTGTWKVTR